MKSKTLLAGHRLKNYKSFRQVVANHRYSLWNTKPKIRHIGSCSMKERYGATAKETSELPKL